MAIVSKLAALSVVVGFKLPYVDSSQEATNRSDASNRDASNSSDASKRDSSNSRDAR
jgi:hypothetical protein